MTDLRALVESDELLFDSAIVSHGYAPHFRDYDIVIDVPRPYLTACRSEAWVATSWVATDTDSPTARSATS